MEIMGGIVRLVELGLGNKTAALPAQAACSVKVVAGVGFALCATFTAPGLEALRHPM